MKAFFNIVCSHESQIRVENEIKLFIISSDTELVNMDKMKYWKDDRCAQFLVEFSSVNGDYKKILKAIKQIWTKKDIHYNESSEFIEVVVYSSILDILQKDEMFISLFLHKNN